MTTKFEVKYLDFLGLPYEMEGGTIISDEMVSKSRWSICHRLIFRFDDQDENLAWQINYNSAATEYQEELPWGYALYVEATLVTLVKKVIEVWEPV